MREHGLDGRFSTRRGAGGSREPLRVSLERAYRCAERFSQRGQIVSAFGDGDQAAVATLVGHRGNRRREMAEVRTREAHASERVVLVRIEAGGDQNELRPELLQYRQRELPVDQLIVRVGRADAERKVDGEAGARTGTDVPRCTRARVVRKLV